MISRLFRKKRIEKQLVRLAELYQSQRQFYEAKCHLEQALAINPRNTQARFLMSRLEVVSKL